MSVVTKVIESLFRCHDTKPGEREIEKIQSYLSYHLGEFGSSVMIEQFNFLTVMMNLVGVTLK